MATTRDRIEHDISQHRTLYLAAVDAGHDGESDYHESEIDRLLAEWQHTPVEQLGSSSRRI